MTELQFTYLVVSGFVSGFIAAHCINLVEWYDGKDISLGGLFWSSVLGCVMGWILCIIGITHLFGAIGILFKPFNFTIKGKVKKDVY
jgi:hypothetical protein